MVILRVTWFVNLEKMSHEYKTPFCSLLQPSHNLEYMDIKSTSNTKDYVDPVEVLIEKDGPKSTFTIKSTIKKEIPVDAIVSTLKITPTLKYSYKRSVKVL
jgi:hypothetical protein